jgi:hypothetical protein
MRYSEVSEMQSRKPLTPKQARARAECKAKAQSRVNDIIAANAIKLASAKRKLTDT